MMRADKLWPMFNKTGLATGIIFITGYKKSEKEWTSTKFMNGA